MKKQLHNSRAACKAAMDSLALIGMFIVSLVSEEVHDAFDSEEGTEQVRIIAGACAALGALVNESIGFGSSSSGED